MDTTKIKICGLTREEDIEAVNRILPDYIGFVFFRRSHRFLTLEQAEALKQKLDPRIQAVGVFVDEEKEVVSELLNRGIIDIAQLHGDEDEAYIASLREMTDKPLIRAFQIRSEDPAFLAETLEKAQRCSADLVLIDSGAGSGKTFDWRILRDFPRKYFLAGGLDAENVEEAVRRTGAWAVDVSSSVETDRRKDEKKIQAFVDAVRRAGEHEA